MFLGSSELWRLRGYREVYYERFWTKLGRYASAGSRTRQVRRGILVMGKQFTTGSPVRVEAQLFGPSLEPLPKSAKPRLSVLTTDGADRRPVDLTPKPSQSDWAGWFQARFVVTKPGDYKLELPVPNSSDILRWKFSVKESNPELDNTRPDANALIQMAGDLDEVAPRLTQKGVLDDLRQRLRGPRPSSDKADPNERSDSPKLFFNLSNADVIPSCVTAERKVQRNRGPVDDLWDDGPSVGQTEDGKPKTVAWALMIGVGLLSVEWLTRKLLRLA
jgi:hypothetical protein